MAGSQGSRAAKSRGKSRDEGQEGHVVTVTEQKGQSVLVAVPMVGFPDGFQLAPGARVVLVSTPSGPAARPLVRAVPGAAPPESDADDGSRVTQDATEVGEQPSVEGSPSEDVVWVVDSVGAEGPEQVIAVRRAGPERN
jgi:hypothetical protein